MPQQTPLEKLADQVLIILGDYRKTNTSLKNIETRAEIAERIVKNSRLCHVIPNKYIDHLRPAVYETLETYKHKDVLESLALQLEVKNEIVARAKMVVEDHVPGGKSARQPQQFRLFVAPKESLSRVEDELNEWARGAGDDFPHIKRTQFAMATDTDPGGSVFVGVLVSYEG